MTALILSIGLTGAALGVLLRALAQQQARIKKEAPRPAATESKGKPQKKR